MKFRPAETSKRWGPERRGRVIFPLLALLSSHLHRHSIFTMAATLSSVKMPAQVKPQPAPRSFNTVSFPAPSERRNSRDADSSCDGQVFEFVFSQPFVKGSRTWEESPKELQGNVMSRIPPDRPIFRDGKTGTFSYHMRDVSKQLMLTCGNRRDSVVRSTTFGCPFHRTISARGPFPVSCAIISLEPVH